MRALFYLSAMTNDLLGSGVRSGKELV
jgi:hypothetical protein